MGAKSCLSGIAARLTAERETRKVPVTTRIEEVDPLYSAAPDKIPVQPSKIGLCCPISFSRFVGSSNPVGGNKHMVIGDRLRALREEKKLSQGEVEKRTGLLRAYISRVENGHTVPAVETLEKFARALEIPMYQLFYDANEPPKLPKLSNLPKRKGAADIAWGSKGKDAR